MNGVDLLLDRALVRRLLPLLGDRLRRCGTCTKASGHRVSPRHGHEQKGLTVCADDEKEGGRGRKGGRNAAKNLGHRPGGVGGRTGAVGAEGNVVCWTYAHGAGQQKGLSISGGRGVKLAGGRERDAPAFFSSMERLFQSFF